MKALWQFAMLSFSVAVTTGQGYDLSDFADFTKSPTEHQIVIIDRPFLVQTVEGVVTYKAEAGEPLAGVLVEIESPGAITRIFRTTTDRAGKFKIAHTREGTYKFKVTLNGFKSIAGAMLVSKKNSKANKIKLELSVGN